MQSVDYDIIFVIIHSFRRMDTGVNNPASLAQQCANAQQKLLEFDWKQSWQDSLDEGREE